MTVTTQWIEVGPDAGIEVDENGDQWMVDMTTVSLDEDGVLLPLDAHVEVEAAPVGESVSAMETRRFGDPWAQPPVLAVAPTADEDDALVLARLFARSVAEQAGRRPKSRDTSPELILTQFAVEFREAISVKRNRADGGAGYARQLADLLRHMAEDLEREDAYR